ncbi:MAG: long-chain fatty acid--CoA ligase [Desulfobacterales bacterium]
MKEMLWHKHKWPRHVRKSLDYPNEPLYSVIDKTADRYGDSIYTVWSGIGQTFEQVRESADKIANFLFKQGIKKGDRIAIFLPNMPHYPVVFFGILKTGAIAVTCNPMYTAGELNFQLKDSGAKVVFCLDHPKFTPITYEAIQESEVKTVVICNVKSFLPKMKAFVGGLLGKIPKSPFYDADKTFSYDAIMAGYEPVPPEVSIDPSKDLALILYTGGTTGTPKGAMLAHRNLYSNLIQNHEWVQLEITEGSPPHRLKLGKEVYIGALPWYHSYGLTLTMIASAHLASRLVCIPDPRAGNPPLSDLLEEIQKQKGTILHCVPALYAGILNHPNVSQYDLSSLKACGSGAAPLAPNLAMNFEAVTGATLFEGYGLTETSPMTHANPSFKATRKFGSVGLPIPDTYAAIVDMETGKTELPQGETGEIAINGPQVMIGYWNRAEETKAVFRTIDGRRYILTGDSGHIDEEGFFVISDRKKDMVNVGGFKAYPREIEDILFEHPKIAMAAAIGVPREDDPDNEFVKAFVVIKEGENVAPEQIIEWAKEKLAGYKRPREVEIVDSLPLSPVGKVLRRELRKAELEKRQRV